PRFLDDSGQSRLEAPADRGASANRLHAPERPLAPAVRPLRDSVLARVAPYLWRGHQSARGRGRGPPATRCTGRAVWPARLAPAVWPLSDSLHGGRGPQRLVVGQGHTRTPDPDVPYSGVLCRTRPSPSPPRSGRVSGDHRRGGGGSADPSPGRGLPATLCEGHAWVCLGAGDRRAADHPVV